MSLRQEFDETGFVILRNAVPSARVTSVLDAIRADYNKARANFIKTYDIGGSSIVMPSYLSDIAHVARWRLSQYAPRKLIKELSMKRADYNTR